MVDKDNNTVHCAHCGKLLNLSADVLEDGDVATCSVACFYHVIFDPKGGDSTSN